MADIVNLIKKAATEAVEASSPLIVTFGNVVSITPLKIMIEQQLTLGAAFFIRTRTVSSDPLKVGEKLLLLRMQGGQRYIILDRVVST